MNCAIRQMKKADWPEVSRIYQLGMDTNRATFQSECPAWEEWNRSHLKNCRLVITNDEKVAGWAALTAVSGRCVYAGVAEVSIYIDPAMQGLGFGTKLLNALISKSEEEGFWTLQSGILQENIASIRLHERCGFRMVGYRERIGRDRFGTWRNTVLMERRSDSDRFTGECSCCGKQ
ncbi:MAG: N-acetyltransferase family protein [Eubacteriales bacterium]|nr:N-acetyltransferase family protein [Eubacteriales bacterium]